jgi:hypothetical protein
MEISKKLRPFFTQQERDALAPQQVALLNDAVTRVLETEGESALTEPRLEGIKEMVMEHLWSPALTAVAQVKVAMDGFESLSPRRNLFAAEVKEPVVDQVLKGIEGWTSLVNRFPVVLGVRTGNRLVLLFRNPEEEHGTTESTALAMVMAYDADELFVCISTDVLEGLNAFLITRSRTSEGAGVFFELAKSRDKWVIGDPVGKIDPNILGDFTGAAAFKSFNNVEERTRKHEARQALVNWQPLYDWKFDPPTASKI